MMLNVLYEQFPDYVLVHGRKYWIETDFREWIRFCELVEDDSVPWKQKVRLMLNWYKCMPDDVESAIYALGDFLAAKALCFDMVDIQNSREDERFDEPAFSFCEDADCIYSDFIACYGMDLQEISYMHWWKFKTLFENLPESAEIKKRIMYRTIDTEKIKDREEKKRIKKIQKEIALHKKKRFLNDYDIGDVFA